ncbi:MAG: YbaK/EbsC family protein [Firmicutes bacterium]|nr:YbaK/EbsC family protein [Bacillota bacterium]
MSLVKQVQQYLDLHHPGFKAMEFAESTATSELAAQALGVEVGQIAKTLVFKGKMDYVMIVAAGDVKIDHKKLREVVGSKTRMATPDEVLEVTGYPVGGVCPLNLRQPVRILLDSSLDRFPVVFAAAGSPNSALPVTLEQLRQMTHGEVVAVSEI